MDNGKLPIVHCQLSSKSPTVRSCYSAKSRYEARVGRNHRLETTKHTKHTNAGTGIRCHLCALVQAVNEVRVLQEEKKTFAGAQE